MLVIFKTLVMEIMEVVLLNYFAHSSDDIGKPWQSILEHLEQTAEKASSYASDFNASDFGYICGMLHDLGKYSQQFQQKLQKVALRVDHSTAGAKEAKSLYGEAWGKLLAYIIAGHHSGLPDYGTAVSIEGTLYARLNKRIEDYSAYKNELDLDSIKPLLKMPIATFDKKHPGFTISFFIRMIYSCLVDADFIDTENYMSPVLKLRGNNSAISQLNDKLREFLSSLSVTETKINIKRGEILKRCISMAETSLGLYTLTVPTGGGKTYSSLAFALTHAVFNDLKRIIYVIPYTSIIEQNAKVFKDVLGNENVLEHHCNYQFDEDNSEEIQNIKEKLKLASENWNIPIVVTTNVQFFESLFSNRSSKCRKIHNMTKSVIIFDEAQMLPFQYLKPCLLALSELVTNYGSTAVLCTATQPSINKQLPSTISPIEIMEDPKQLYEDFRKVRVISRNEIEDTALTAELNQLEQVLCIVNTRRHAKEIFSSLEGNVFHLSTLMCPVHRQSVLKEVKQYLRDKLPCKVVSTQLIEAGVDIDFPMVYRAITGIDSIVQSAGRCNREGALKEGTVIVFKPVSEYAKIKGYLERTAKIAEMVLRKFDDPISLEAIDYYFKMLYSLEGKEALDKKEILNYFEEGHKSLEFNFKTAAEQFRLIENGTYSIVIPYNEDAQSLITQARFSPYPHSMARKLQPYTVSIYEFEYKTLLENSALKTINDSFVILEDFERNYDKSTGLIVPKNPIGEAIFV